MAEPTTVNKALIIPNTGDLVGTWGSAALNPDFTAIDGMFGGVAIVSLTNANVTLSAPAGSITPGAGPNQSQNAVIRFTGTLTGNCIITFPLPGFYIIENLTTGNFYVQLTTGAGQTIATPQNSRMLVLSDGTDMRFANDGTTFPGSFLLASYTTLPSWITACTVRPWLLCDGTAVSRTTYAALFAVIGTDWGTGDGVTTFNVPDYRNKLWLPIDNFGTGANALVTNAGSGINGDQRGSNGGNQLLQAHVHTYGINVVSQGNITATGGTVVVTQVQSNNAGNSQTSTQNTGGGTSQNMPPAAVGGIVLIHS